MGFNHLYLYTFGVDITEPGNYEGLRNEYNAEVLKVEFNGNCEAIIEGRIDSKSNWTSLNVKKVNATSIAQKVSAEGIYEVNIAAIAEVRVRVVSVTDKVTIVGSVA